MILPQTLRRTAAAFGLASLAACGSYSSTPMSPSGGTGGGTTSPNTIVVSNNSFNPSALTVPVGTTVTWSWSTTAMDHNVVPDDGSTPSGSGVPANYPHTYAFTFMNAGTYHYHCQVHGGPGGVGMSGTVVVQ
jgi:plastocyanin